MAMAYETPAEELEHLMLFGMSQECCDLIDDLRSALRKWVLLAEHATATYGVTPHPEEQDCLDRARNALAAMEPRANVAN